MSSSNVTNYEYQDLRKKIAENLKDKEGWGDGFESSVGQNLIDIAADAADILSYMIERRSQESYQTTARLRSSIATKSSELGYRSQRAISASGTLALTLTDQNGDAKPVAEGGVVVIPEGTEVYFDGETFVTNSDTIVESGEHTVDVRISQGMKDSIAITPTYEASFQRSNYVLIPNYEYIDEYSLKITSNDVEFMDVRSLDNVNGTGIGSLSYAASDDPYYDVRYAHDGMRIQFGDGVFGYKPDSLIEISFVRTDGEKVRVLSYGESFQFNFDVLTDGVNVTPQNEYSYTLTNKTQIIGGRPPESVNDIRVNSPLYLATNNRAVSLDGYSYWAKRSNVGGIIDANAFGEYELDTLLYNLNNVYISYLTETGVPLTQEQKQNLIDFVKERDVGMSHIVPSPANEIRLGVEVDVKVNDVLKVAMSDLHSVIKSFLLNYYKRSEGSIGIEYQKSVLINEFYDLKTNVSGVDYNVVDFVDVNIYAYQKFYTPLKVTNGFISLWTEESDRVVGKKFSIKLDGIEYTVEADAEDVAIPSEEFYARLLYKMRDHLFSVTQIIPEIVLVSSESGNEYMLNLRARDNLGSFYLTVDVGDFQDKTDVKNNYQIYPRRFKNISGEILLRNSVEIISENTGEVLYKDDGNGNWISIDGSVISMNPKSTGAPFSKYSETGSAKTRESWMVDYASSNIIIPSDLPVGTYYVKYKQDKYDNFGANDSAAVTIIPPKSNFEDEEETFSKIKFITG